MVVPEPRFDAAYYRRFYGLKPVHDRRRIGLLAKGVLALAAWWKVPVRSVLDVGAGRGYWRDWLADERPSVRYHGIDVSEFACRRYGHEQADLATWRPSRTYDLVVCQSMLQYLDDRAAAAAIDSLGAACRGLLWLEVPTLADRIGAVDHEATDLDVHWRTGAWYRRRLTRHFRQIGGGLWRSSQSPAVFFELELPDGRCPTECESAERGGDVRRCRSPPNPLPSTNSPASTGADRSDTEPGTGGQREHLTRSARCSLREMAVGS